jgi:hypothetical protein
MARWAAQSANVALAYLPKLMCSGKGGVRSPTAGGQRRKITKDRSLTSVPVVQCCDVSGQTWWVHSGKTGGLRDD